MRCFFSIRSHGESLKHPGLPTSPSPNFFLSNPKPPRPNAKAEAAVSYRASFPSLGAKRMRIEIDRLDLTALVGAPLDKVCKEFEGIEALLARLERVSAARVELLDRALEADAQRVGRDVQHFAHRIRDPRAVGMNVVQCRELGRDLAAQAVRE